MRKQIKHIWNKLPLSLRLYLTPVIKGIIADPFKLVLPAILLFALGTRLYNLSAPEGYFFDEIYHAFTAREYLHGNPAAYQFSATPPEGVAYVWDHPPVSRLIMAGFMVIFGENSFGWRIGSVVCAIFIIIGVYKLALRLFNNRPIATLAALVLSMDGLFFTMSRIAMNDLYLVVFLVWSAYFYTFFREHVFSVQLNKSFRENFKKFFANRYLWLVILFSGLAAASKVTGFFILGIFAIEMVVGVLTDINKQYKKIPFLLIFALLYAVGVVLVYIASYTQSFLLGNSFQLLIETLQQTWWYHTNLNATHPYSSTPSDWIVSYRPVFMYYNGDGNVVRAIANVGNYVYFYLGLASIFALLMSLARRYDWKKLLIMLCYAGLFIPWLLSPRIMFFYHYMPSAAFMAIPLGWMLYRMYKYNIAWAFVAGIFVAAIVINFVVVYPFNNGIPVATDMYLNFYSKMLHPNPTTP